MIKSHDMCYIFIAIVSLTQKLKLYKIIITTFAQVNYKITTLSYIHI